MTTVDLEDDGIDIAVAAYRDAAGWHVEDLTHDHLADLETLAAALRRFPGEEGLGMVAVDEDFFVLVRVEGGVTRALLSDITAADEWELASSVVEHLGLPQPEDDDDEVPAGRLDLLTDLGVAATELRDLLEDDEAYPDEMLSDVARLLGFGEQFDELVGLTSA